MILLRSLRRPLLCVAVACGGAWQSACVVTRPPAPTAMPAASWEQRVTALQHMGDWALVGRAAAAVGVQGWQASLNWRQSGSNSEVHLAGPLGVGASVLRLTPAGVSLDGAASGDASLALLQERLGFDLPLTELRYWLLGVPQPDVDFTVERNAEDRAQLLTQAGWTIAIDRYLPAGGDLLPGHLVLQHADVRVRIAVDHWDGLK